MKTLSALILLVLLSMPAMAIEFEIKASNTAFVYPLDKEAMIEAKISKDFLDRIEDLRYTLTIEGPAAFQDGAKSKSDEVADFKKDIEINFTLKLEHTPNPKGEQVIVMLSGTYVSNSIILGGKKTFNESTEFSVISREGEDSENEVSSVALQQDLTDLQREIADLRLELTETQIELDQKNDALNSLIFWNVLIVILIVAGISGYYFIKKRVKHKKKFKEEDY